jgi:hypothetical protein
MWSTVIEDTTKKDSGLRDEIMKTSACYTLFDHQYNSEIRWKLMIKNINKNSGDFGVISYENILRTDPDRI